MKLRVVGIVLAVALLSAGYLLAKSPIITEFTGQDTFLAVIFPGNISCPGGQPDPTWSQGSPCTPGSRVHLRDAQFLYHLQSTDDRLTGTMQLLSANGNYDGWRPDLPPPPGSPGSGQMWGTIRVTVDGHPDEVWEGTWTGTRTVTGQVVVITTHVLLFGTGGRIQGLKAEYRGTADPLKGGTYQGWILAPPGK
jgi:hypothetical protein